MDIGKKIIELRTKKGWSQYRLYKEAGIGQSTLSQIESGVKKGPNADTLQKIANALGVSMAEFDDNTEVMDKLRYQVLEHMGTMQLNKEEQAAYEYIKKMPPDQQQISFLKTMDKFKSLSAEDQEALSKIIDSLASSRK